MNPIQNKLFQASAAFIGLSAVLALAALRFGPDAGMRRGLLTGLAIAAANGLAGALSLAWAAGRPDTVFYRTFFGGILWKVAVLGGAFWILARQSSVHPATALITHALATFAFNGVEIFLLRNARYDRALSVIAGKDGMSGHRV